MKGDKGQAQTLTNQAGTVSHQLKIQEDTPLYLCGLKYKKNHETQNSKAQAI